MKSDGLFFYSIYIYIQFNTHFILSSSSAHIFFPSFDDSDDVSYHIQTEQQDEFQYTFNVSWLQCKQYWLNHMYTHNIQHISI